MKVRKLRLGPLDVRVVANTDKETGPVVVLLHGFGAPGSDLVGLAPHLHTSPDVRFVFPEAPLDLGPAFAGGRAWWMIDMLALQQAMAAGAFRDLARSVPEGLADARAQLSGCLDALQEKLAPESLVLGGFSQGAMLALDFALRDKRRLDALVLFSTTLIAEAEWAPRFSSRTGLPVVLSHGRYDPVLPYQGAERVRALMEDAGLDVRFVPFEGMHEIPEEAVAAGRSCFEKLWSERNS